MIAKPIPAAMAQQDGGGANVLAALLEARTGQRLAADRAWRIGTAVRTLLAELSLDHVDQLASRVVEGRDPDLGDRVVDALLNQETSFFRDAGVIEAAVEALATLAPRPRMRIWSAACSTGQEPLSLAMLLAEGGGTMPEILATDVSAAAIARARAGVYTQFEIQRGLPIRRLMQWFTGEGNRWIASTELTGTIGYRRHNLVADPTPAGGFELILCRNVLFYLAPATREQVLASLAKALKPDGLLLLGAGETVIGQSPLLRPSRRVRGMYERADLA